MPDDVKLLTIAHLSAYFQPLLGYQEYYLAREMAMLGHQVHVITSDRYHPFPDFESTAGPLLGKRVVGTGVMQMDGFTVHRLPLLWEHRNRVIVRGVSKCLKRIRPDIVIMHGTTNLMNVMPLLRISEFGYRVIADEHNLPSVADNSLLARLYYAAWGAWIRRLVREGRIKLVGVADECVEFAARAFGLRREEVYNIPLGADHRLFRPDISVREAMRSELGFAQEDVVVIYTGKICHSKDPALLLDACLQIADECRLKFLFVGNVESAYRGRFDSARAGSPRVVHVPAVSNSDLWRYYNAADIACWPKHASLSMIEAASTGLPIVVARELGERLSYQNGIGIRQCSLEDIREAVKALSEDRQMRVEMGRRGRRLVEDQLSYQVVARRFLELALDEV